VSDEDILALVRTEAGPCPACGRSEAKPIFWGYPNPMDFDRFGDRVSWGGCCLPERPKAYVCGACGEEYGVLPMPSDDELESPFS
jgi:hypothetical protein